MSSSFNVGVRPSVRITRHSYKARIRVSPARSRVVGSFTLIRSPPRNCCDIRQILVGDSGRPTVGGRLARKLSQQEAIQLAARRKRFRGGRPPQPRSCPRCGTPCASATQAAAHCVGRNVPAAVASVAAPLPGSPSPKALTVYPRWKYHRKKGGVVVNNVQAEEALGEGWSDIPV